LALVGVSNGALQFMAYERIKMLGFKQKRRLFERAGKPWTAEDDKLVGSTFMLTSTCILLLTNPLFYSPQSNTTYIMASGASKLFALAVTYPYQVVRARIQVRIPRTTLLRSPKLQNLTSHPPPNRTTPPRTYTLTSPRASRGHIPKEA
jgi:solute carrier family 25 folate transporter 32